MRSWSASTSSGSSRDASRTGTRVTSGSRSESNSSGTGSPAKSQITVRSVKRAAKHSPLSIPRMRPSVPSSTCPLLRSALLATRSNTASARSSGRVCGEWRYSVK